MNVKSDSAKEQEMTKNQIKWAAQVAWCERHLATVMELECSSQVIEGAIALLQRARAIAAAA